MKEELLIGRLPSKLQPPARLAYYKARNLLESEFYLLPQLVGSGKKAIDIGANYGLYTYQLSKLCNSVESFEPQIWLYDKLCKYNISNINVHNVGLSNRQDQIELNIPMKDGKRLDGLASFRDFQATAKYQEDEVEILTVPVKKLDEYQFQDVSFIKIDVEGYETEVLEGAISTIQANKPNILIEIEQRHIPDQPISSVFKIIQDLDYSGYFVLDGKHLPIEEFSFEVHQKPYIEELETLNFTNVKKYVNNFIFLPRSNNYNLN
jgi:FkbM family methyltransferase